MYQAGEAGDMKNAYNITILDCSPRVVFKMGFITHIS
jgi:hypothetical protein